MFARVTQFEMNAHDGNLLAVQTAFERHVVPELRKLPGYEGCYFLQTKRNKAHRRIALGERGDDEGRGEQRGQRGADGSSS